MEDKSAEHVISLENEEYDGTMVIAHDLLEIEIDEPKAGLIFDSKEDVYEYYSKYAKRVGFGITKRTSTCGDDGQLKYFSIECSRAGKSRGKSKLLKPTLVTKTECKAKVRVTLQEDEKYMLTTVNLDHNHGLSPAKGRFFRSHRRLDDHVKRRLELNDQAEISVTHNYNSFLVEADGPENLTFFQKDARNHIDKARRLRLGMGDAEAVIDYDDDNRIRNLFWADARSRKACESFGDVVTFDTTYLTNKYDMPFAPFVGVNHHGQSTLLGCGLLSNEDTDTFVWLFKSWLTCMSGCSPKAIITDQCKAMKKAIAMVFPNARHRWCLWHIMKKVPEKLRGYKEYKGIKFTLHNVVYESYTKDEFEVRWSGMIEKYNLSENEWLGGLYEERHRWVPTYVKNTFWAGMSTTQCSESMNAFFDDYVNSKTTLKQFVEQYDNALRSKFEKEKQADFNSFHSMYECITFYDVEKQFQSAYTNAKFSDIQKELKKMIYCHASLLKEQGSIYTFQVVEIMKIPIIEKKVKTGEISRRVTFVVYFNKVEYDVQCTCQHFDFKGIMCCHSLTVLLTHMNVQEVPSKYILTRWRKDVNREYKFVKINYGSESIEPNAKRYDLMCREFYKVVTLAADSEDKCNTVLSCIQELAIRIVDDGSTCGRNLAMLDSSIKCADDSAKMSKSIPKKRKNSSRKMSKESCLVRSPLAVQRKGRPHGRFKGSVEKVIRKLKSSRKIDRGSSHDQEEAMPFSYASHTVEGIGTQESMNLMGQPSYLLGDTSMVAPLISLQSQPINLVGDQTWMAGNEFLNLAQITSQGDQTSHSCIPKDQ